MEDRRDAHFAWRVPPAEEGDHREGHKEREGCEEEKATTESTEGGHISRQPPGVSWDLEFALSAATSSGAAPAEAQSLKDDGIVGSGSPKRSRGSGPP